MLRITILNFMVSFSMFVTNVVLFAQSNDLEYEQVTIRLNVEKLGIYEMEAIYSEENVYLPMIDLFRKLEIYLQHSPELDTIKGFILNKENSFSFNQFNNQIAFRDKTKTLKSNDVITDFSDVYFPMPVYQEIFGFDLKFNFRELMVNLSSDIELPIIKQLRIKNMRSNLNAISGEAPSDTTIHSRWHWFRGLVFDWNLSSTENSLGESYQQLRSSIGVELFGGELNWKSNLVHDSLFKLQNSSIKWRYVNDRIPIIKQVEMGNINTNLTGQTMSDFYAVKLSNAAYSFKKTFGTYVIQRHTEPNWEVELYLNGVLVNFTTADINGNFSFEIPLIYGNSTVLLRYYGPWGQESVEEIDMNIPFSFTAQGHVEYTTTAGITRDTSHVIFNKSKVSYGLNRWATLSAGYEFFNGNTLNKHVFSGAANVALGKKTLLNYTYLHNSNHAMELMFRSKRNLTVNAKHRQFIKNQFLIQTTNRSESELDLNLPIWSKKVKVALRSTNRFILGRYNHSFISESAMSVFYKRVNSNFSLIMSRETQFSLSTSIYFKNKWTVMYKSFYNLSSKQFTTSTLQIQKKFSNKFYAESSLTYNFVSKGYQVGVSVFIDLNFLRSAITASFKKQQIATTQSFMGSVHISSGPKKVMFTNTSNIGKSGIDVLIFLDINHNNKKDANEPLVKNASVAINKGKQVLTENDSVHRFVSLEPYSNYLLTIANNGFPYISWILEKSTWSITTSPNQISKIYVPVKPMGEVAMSISMQKAGKNVPASRLIVYIYNESNIRVAKVLTERDGSFTYMGLAPGNYTVKLDDQQLKGLGLSNKYTPLNFSVKPSEQGDYIDGLSMQLNELE